MTSKADHNFVIAGRPISAEHPPYIIAELSANHAGDLGRALASIEAAKNAGADAVKIQSYTPDTITIDSTRPEFLIPDGLWAGQNLYALYKTAYTPFEWHPALFEKAAAVGITLFSSPFDFTAVDMLEGLNTPAYKIASFELIDIPLIQRVAATGKPLIMSTGMATKAEIAQAVSAARNAGAKQICLLHCISSYPAKIADASLATLADLQHSFDVTVGLSDHSIGNSLSVAAVTLGAAVIEKHFMLDDKVESADAAFSLTAPELEQLCSETKAIWAAKQMTHYGPKDGEKTSLLHRRSLYVVAPMQKGDLFSPENVRSIRPGNGLPPADYETILGQRAATDIQGGTPLSAALIDGKVKQ